MGKLIDIIKARRSIRRFEEMEVSKEDINNVVDAGIWAPSACDKKDWRFIVINEKETLGKIHELGGSSSLKSAPCCIMICYDKRTDNAEYRDDIQSASAAIQNMLLMIHDMGLGGCWVNHLPPKGDLKRLLSIPKHVDPVGAIILGHPLEKKDAAKDDRDPNKYVSYERFDFEQKRTKDKKKSFTRKIMRRAYYMMPANLRVHLRGLADRYEKKYNE